MAKKTKKPKAVLTESTPMPDMVTVVSSNVNRIGFDTERDILYVEYKTGGTYKYHPFTIDQYEELCRSDSIGSWLARNVRNNAKIAYERVG